ncbi:tetratricopeptide repeat protein [Mucilaginibacter arboris]|uniref:Tetratricopeptide repeat protein n=1 Tax=Mucilaginibacter arboris TaxID=2682090 RepID=A0A7K1SYB9_9SPHI|nr:tetratricopeptide repeat protein [Mucilaginibacter arboris]MVN22258.1 tetratricopeptide repeat protein [Mucilaginibacter arboris]
METSPIERQTLRILFLASEPTNAGKLRLGNELQEVRNRLSTNSFFELKDRQAVKPDDVLQTILNYKPHIVHFAGHGQETGEICFEDEKGNSKVIPPDALASLFKLVNEYVKCVLINACYSEIQAKAISQFVPIVIGTKKEISDSAAIKFSTGFYTALDPDLSQKSLLKAFDSGCISIRFENLPEHLTPIIIEGLPEVRFSSEVDTAFLSIARPQGKVFDALIKGLSLTGKRMGVSDDIVLKILGEKITKMKLHSEGIEEYEKYLKDILRDEYPLSETSQLALLQLQNGLELTNEDVTGIKDKILSNKDNLTTAEKWYDRGNGQRTIGNIDKAIEYFSLAIEKDSDYSAAYYERGDCYDMKGNFDLAISDFTKAIEYNNKWEVLSNLRSAYFSRARAYHAIKTDDKDKRNELLNLSLADWNKTLELKSDQPEGFYGRGLVYIDLNKLTEAIDDFKKSYDLAPKDERKQSYILALSRCYYMLGQNDESSNWMKLYKGSKELSIDAFED